MALLPMLENDVYWEELEDKYTTFWFNDKERTNKWTY